MWIGKLKAYDNWIMIRKIKFKQLCRLEDQVSILFQCPYAKDLFDINLVTLDWA